MSTLPLIPIENLVPADEVRRVRMFAAGRVLDVHCGDSAIDIDELTEEMRAVEQYILGG